MDHRGTSLALYYVICPRCETVSRVEESACPYCGADRHGAVLTKGSAGAVRAVQAARAVIGHSGHSGEQAEPRRVEGLVRLRPFESDTQLPVPVAAGRSGIRALLAAPRMSTRNFNPVLIGGVIIGAVALCAFFWQRVALDNDILNARMAGVSVAGAIRKADPPMQSAAVIHVPPTRPVHVDPAIRAAQTRFLAMALPTATVTFDASATQQMTGALKSPLSFDCCAVPSDLTERPIAFSPDAPAPVLARDPPPAPVVEDAHPKPAAVHARAKQKAVAVVEPRKQTCTQKNHKACIERTSRHPAKPDPTQKRAQARPVRRDPTAVAAQTTSVPSDYNRVSAPPPPAPPVATSDRTWMPGDKAH